MGTLAHYQVKYIDTQFHVDIENVQNEKRKRNRVIQVRGFLFSVVAQKASVTQYMLLGQGECNYIQVDDNRDT